MILRHQVPPSVSRGLFPMLLWGFLASTTGYAQGADSPGVVLSMPSFGASAADTLRQDVRVILQEWSRDPVAVPPRVERAVRYGSGQSGDDAASVSSGPSTGPISGYMDFHYNNRQNEDAVLDFHRFVLLFSHSFSDRIRFVAELELEHVVVSNETEGELELEQAYVDFLLSRAFNVRAGMLMPASGTWSSTTSEPCPRPNHFRSSTTRA